MAIPVSPAALSMKDIAQEALHGTWGTGTINDPISLYDLVNGGQVKGSGDSYPAVNQNCTPNPADRADNYVELKQVYKKANTVTTGPFTHYFNPAQATSASAITGNTILYSDSALTTPVGEWGTSSGLFYWSQNISGLTTTEMICGYNYGGNWDTTASSTPTNQYCGQ